MLTKTMFMICVFLWVNSSALFAATPVKGARTDTGKFLEEYRFEPFQWIYPEYYYKADVVNIRKKSMTHSGFKKVAFFGFSAFIPEKYKEIKSESQDIISFVAKDGSKFMIMKASGESIVCSETKRRLYMDFCSAFTSPRDLFFKLYTMTPDQVKTTGDKWIVHDKGREFYDTEKIEIYTSEAFEAFAKRVKTSMVGKTGYSHNLTIFHSRGPKECYLDVRWTGPDDVMNVFLSTLE